MKLGTFAEATSEHSPTVYTVLAESARSHSRRYLATEVALAGTATVVILAWHPPWWPIAALALAVGLYASWGLLARRGTAPERERGARQLRLIVAVLATVATLAGLGGLAVKAFWGTAPGPYGMCYGPDGSSYACEADGSRRPASGPAT